MVDEIKKNVRRDRERLESFQDLILKNIPEGADEEEGRPSMAGLAALAESVSRIADALSRSNSQLVEVAKIESRRSGANADSGFTSDEQRGAIFAQLEEERSGGGHDA